MKTAPAIRFHQLDEAFRKADFPVEADPNAWRPLVKVFSPLAKGDNWLGYDVTEVRTHSIKHEVYFMGRRSDTKVGYFITLELSSPKGCFKLSVSDTSKHSRSIGKTPKTEIDKADLDIRATSQEVLDLIYILAKSLV